MKIKELNVTLQKSESSEDNCCSKARVILTEDLVFNIIPVEQILTVTMDSNVKRLAMVS